jgi:hypothetical protein
MECWSDVMMQHDEQQPLTDRMGAPPLQLTMAMDRCEGKQD